MVLICPGQTSLSPHTNTTLLKDLESKQKLQQTSIKGVRLVRRQIQCNPPSRIASAFPSSPPSHPRMENRGTRASLTTGRDDLLCRYFNPLFHMFLLMQRRTGVSAEEGIGLWHTLPLPASTKDIGTTFVVANPNQAEMKPPEPAPNDRCRPGKKDAMSNF